MLDKVVDINAIEKIEVIKGPSASVYGADAVGGAINIITKKGTVKNRGTIDISTGSWKHHNYNLSYSGSAGKNNSFKYLVNATRDMSGNTHYKDGQTGKNYEYANTDYKEDSTYVKLENDFDKNHNLRFTHSYNHGYSGYVQDKIHMSDKWELTPAVRYSHYKGITQKTPTGATNVKSSSIDQMMNKIVPPNQYAVELNYNNRQFNANLSELIYSGCSTETFTDKRFMVTNLNLNYDVKKDMTVYLAVNNLFNEAYQTKYYAHTGKGAYPGLGRNFMIGLRYKF